MHLVSNTKSNVIYQALTLPLLRQVPEAGGYPANGSETAILKPAPGKPKVFLKEYQIN